MDRQIRVALAGVGNCASSLVQGVEYYRSKSAKTIGLSLPRIKGYSVDDISFVAAFDIDSRKVGRDLSEAISAEPNNVRTIAQPRKLNVRVSMAQPLDGVSPFTAEKIQVSAAKPSNLPQVLRDSRADILVNLTPTGSTKASEMYADAAVNAGCAFINATPAKIAGNGSWQARFRKAALALVGDDVMDQIGSTVLHRNLLSFLVGRGAHVDETYQLDIGGGTESEIALDKRRYEIKRSVKTAAVAAVVPYKFPIVAGSSDFVDFMENRRTSYFWIKGVYFAGTEFTIDMRLSLEDGPACAGLLIDAVRMVKAAKDASIAGPLLAVSAYGFKAPPRKLSESDLQTDLSWYRGSKRVVEKLPKKS
ncbi:MAG: hypothetical protein AUJ07_10765 [Crenarchaeota archaeon 13_1_40CM_3_53_5]|nr:MAG: hypothetical protein AUJ07_10765 [Crenarchaeota archaeon 13_1_40CM_3_53_5]